MNSKCICIISKVHFRHCSTPMKIGSFMFSPLSHNPFPNNIPGTRTRSHSLSEAIIMKHRVYFSKILLG